MIILAIVLFTVLTFYSWMFIKNGVLRTVLGSLAIVLLAGSVFSVTMNLKENWGLKEVKTVQTHEIFTAGDTSAPYGMMIKAEIGQNTGNYVLVYRNDKASKTPDTNFKPDTSHIVDAVKKSATYKLVDADKATVTTTTVRLQFKSDAMKFWFGIGGQQNQLVSQKSVVAVPKDTWLVLTQAQVEKLTKEAPAMQKQMEAEVKANPEKAMQLAELQKSNPKEYAKMQVEQIKQLLGIKD